MAKDSLVRSLPSDFQTSSNVNASTANLYIFDLGLDYFSTLAYLPSLAVAAAGQEDLERVVAVDADAPAAPVAEQGLHFGGPLRVGGAAQPETVGEQAGPVLAGPQVAAGGEAPAPQVLGPLVPDEDLQVPVDHDDAGPEPGQDRGQENVGGVQLVGPLPCLTAPEAQCPRARRSPRHCGRRPAASCSRRLRPRSA